MKAESIVAYFSIIGTSLIIFGLTYNIFLYQKLNIEIVSYIELGESLLLFLPTLPSTLFLLPLTLIAIDTLLPSSIRTKPLVTDSIYGRLFDGALLKKKAVFVVFVTCFVVALIILFWGYLFESSFIIATGLGFILTYMVLHFHLVIRLVSEIILSKKVKIPLGIPLLLFMCLFILIGTLYAAERKKYRILHGIKNPKVKIIYKNKGFVETDFNIRYIGKTNILFFSMMRI